MSDLYDEIEELHGVVRVLTGDVDRLRGELGPKDIQQARSTAEEGNRRSYVRAIFSLIEAVIERHKSLLLHLSTDKKIELGVGVQEVLEERGYAASENGKVTEKGQFLQLTRKLRTVYRAAGEAFGQELQVSFKDQGWQSFQEAIEIRDRLTHPKTFDDCLVNDPALAVVESGENWFKSLNREFVRIAEEHRAQNNW